MLSLDAERIQTSFLRMKRASKIIGLIFRVVLVLNVAMAVVLFGTSIVVAFDPSILPVRTEPFGIGTIPILLSQAIACVALYILMRLFEDISKGESPFTFVQARRLAIIGCLLTVGILVEALVFTGSNPSLSIPDAVNMGYEGSPSVKQMFFINGAYVVGAILSFCLSYTFKYGALLQKLSDDTI